MALNFANNNSLSAITAKPSGLSGGSMNLISTQTASGSSTISFTSGIDSTYDEYVFKFYNIHPATDNKRFQFQANVSGGSGYNETMTTTVFRASHNEAGDDAGLSYMTALDQAQGTAFQTISDYVGADADQCCNGSLSLFSPSSTTFVKHFINRTATYQAGNFSMDTFVAGYINTTSAITDIQFKFESGNIDSGVIKLYGIS